MLMRGESRWIWGEHNKFSTGQPSFNRLEGGPAGEASQ